MSYTLAQLKQMSRKQLIDTVLSHQQLILGLASEANTIPRQIAQNAINRVVQTTIEEGQNTLETLIIPIWRANMNIQIIIERLAFALAAGGRGEQLQKTIAGQDESLVIQWMRLEKLVTGAQYDNGKHYSRLSARLDDLSHLIPDLVRGIRACESGDNGDALRAVFDDWGESNLRALLVDVNEQIAKIGRPHDEGREYFGDIALAISEKYPERAKGRRDRVIHETVSELEHSDHPLAESALTWWNTIIHTSSGRPASPSHCRNELSRQIKSARKRRIAAETP